MSCKTIRENLGPYLDGELPSEISGRVDEHLAICHACADELEALRTVVAAIATPGDIEVPKQLWGRIAQRLDEVAEPRRPWVLRLPRRPMALAASILLAVAIGFGALNHWGDGANAAKASEVDFAVLLDQLPFNVDSALQRFVTHYRGKEIRPSDAKKLAPALSFDLPETLPGGFARQSVYALQFGSSPGIAVKYQRGDQTLCAIFHRPVSQEHFGSHQDYPCVVGQHDGHMVAIGEWKLVHLTDPTTCHCVLSKLDQDTELPLVMAALAPGSTGSSAHYHEHPDR